MRTLIDIFRTLPCDVDERVLPDESPGTYALRMAEAKARAASRSLSGEDETEWIIGADTIVVLDGEIFGKPLDGQDARKILRRLRGKSHEVLSGICILHRRTGQVCMDLVSTQVRMKALSEDEIEEYIRTGEPFGKAGAYAIQGLGGRLVEGIQGSFTNVVGLPLERLGRWMEALGILSNDAGKGGRFSRDS